MSIEGGITFFLAIFIFGITPGPGVFAIVARAMVFGAPSCTALAFGMTISDALYLILASLGLAAVAQHWSELFFAIRVVGAAYLLYLGWKMFATRPNIDGTPPQAIRGGWLASFVQGFLISASNPKVILFYIAFLPTFMDLTKLTAGDMAVASLLTVLALMLGLMLIAGCAAWASTRLRTPRAVRRLNRGAGSILIAAGVYLATRH